MRACKLGAILLLLFLVVAGAQAAQPPSVSSMIAGKSPKEQARIKAYEIYNYTADPLNATVLLPKGFAFTLGVNKINKTTIKVWSIKYDEKKEALKLCVTAEREGKEVAIHNPWYIVNPNINVSIPTTGASFKDEENILEATEESLYQSIMGMRDGPATFDGPDPHLTAISSTTSGWEISNDGDTTFATLITSCVSCTLIWDATPYAPRIDTDSDQFTRVRRVPFSFDTSAIPDDATIDSGWFSVVPYTKSNTFASSSNLTITSDKPANPPNEASSDFTKNGTDVLTDYPITYASFGGSFGNMTFNSAGLSNVNKTGYTTLTTRIEADVISSWAHESSKSIYYSFRALDHANRPRIEIDYTEAGGTAAPVAAFNLTSLGRLISDYPTGGNVTMRGQTIAGIDTSTGTPTSWLWYAGGTRMYPWLTNWLNSTSQNPTFTPQGYSGPGEYTLCLMATNAGGSSTKCQKFRVVFQRGET